MVKGCGIGISKGGTVMREIKFRCWVGGEMTYGIPLSIMGNQSEGINTLDDFFKACDDDVGTKIMQYTGLKDKNGKEIYEGDIVEVTCIGSYGEEKWTHKVEYDNELARFSPFSYYHGSLEVGEEEFEVIGNIYENADLLDGKGGE